MIEDQYEEKFIKNFKDIDHSKAISDNNTSGIINNGPEEEKKCEISPKSQSKLDARKKIGMQLAIQIPMIKGKSISATLKNYHQTMATKKSDDNLETLEEEENYHSGKINDPNSNNSIRVNKSENDIKKLKNWSKNFNLKLEISKKLKRRGDFGLVGIKKEKCFYYYREKFLENNEKSYFNGQKWIFISHDDLKLFKKNQLLEEETVFKKAKDDLNFMGTTVNFIQKP